MGSEARHEALVWLRYAKEDIQTAQLLLSNTATVPRHAAWLAQQASEKALKAYLIAEKIPFPRTHDLDLLLERMPTHSLIRQLDVDLSALTEYAVDARYPGDLADVTADEARNAVGDAATILAAVQKELKQERA
jgi:HEPN domain-containing protein